MALTQRNGIWQWRKMVDGVMINRSTKTADKKLAEQLAKKWEHEAVQAIVYDGERPVTVHEAIKGFLDERKHMKGYGSAVTHMNRWKDAVPNVQMKSLQQHEVQEVVTKRIAEGASTNTVAVFVIYWNALINYCERKKLSPGPKLERVKSQRTRFRVISLEEEAAMLAATCPNAKYPGKNPNTDAMRQDNQDVLVCLLHLGARINEAQNLRWSDISFEHNTIFVKRLKRGDECLLVMTAALRAVMERRYAARTNNWVFPTKCENPKTNAQWVNTIVARAGISLEAGKITSHTFRHSCATRLLRAGMDITKVQKFLGHKNLNSTLVYLHAMPSEVAQQAAAVFNRG
jgi:integrase